MVDAEAVARWSRNLYCEGGEAAQIKKREDFYSWQRLPAKSASRGEGIDAAKRYYFGFSPGGNGEEDNALFSYQSDAMHAYEMTLRSHKEKLKIVVEAEIAGIINTSLNAAGLDWEIIAEKVTESCKTKYLPIECFIQYRNNVDPSINKAKWSAEEEARLIKLAESHGEHDWVAIAHELGGSRTPIDCLCHYQQAFNTKLFTLSEWNAEEEVLLKEAAQSDKGRSKNWKVIASKVPGRTNYQCYIKWRRTANMHVDTEEIDGKWGADDERRLYLAVIAYKALCLDDQKKSDAEIRKVIHESLLAESSSSSTQSPPTDLSVSSSLTKSNGRWLEIAQHIKSKNDARCRDKWTTSLDNSISSEPWSEYEDSVLLALVAKYGPGKWSSYSIWLPGRTDASLLTRWTKLSNKSAREARGGALKKRKAVIPPRLNRKGGSVLNESNFARQVRLKKE